MGERKDTHDIQEFVVPTFQNMLLNVSPLKSVEANEDASKPCHAIILYDTDMNDPVL